jgi:adenylate cyclase, class 2
MHVLNVELKARCNHLDIIRTKLTRWGAQFFGIDQQTDTYFKTSQGRLKLREGNIEYALIYYERNNQADPKPSSVILYEMKAGDDSLKELLSLLLGVDGEVNKTREIYYIDNVKFHLDQVHQLGTFIEIEAADEESVYDKETLTEQCTVYSQALEITPSALVSESYLDLLKKNNDF